MEKLWTLRELMDRYGWSEDTALRKIRKEMRHIGKGKRIRVPESALREWEQKTVKASADEIREGNRGKRKSPKLNVISRAQSNLVPRSREEALRQLGMA